MTQIKTTELKIILKSKQQPLFFKTELLATPTESGAIFIPIELKNERNVPYCIFEQ